MHANTARRNGTHSLPSGQIQASSHGRFAAMIPSMRTTRVYDDWAGLVMPPAWPSEACNIALVRWDGIGLLPACTAGAPMDSMPGQNARALSVKLA